jgi:hypothetical protein
MRSTLSDNKGKEIMSKEEIQASNERLHLVLRAIFQTCQDNLLAELKNSLVAIFKSYLIFSPLIVYTILVGEVKRCAKDRDIFFEDDYDTENPND